MGLLVVCNSREAVVVHTVVVLARMQGHESHDSWLCLAVDSSVSNGTVLDILGDFVYNQTGESFYRRM